MVAGGLGQGGFGDLVALLMTILSAFYIVLVRKFRDAPVIWAGAVSAFLLFGLGWLVTDPLRVTGQDALLLIVFGSTFATAVVLWTEQLQGFPDAALPDVHYTPVRTVVNFEVGQYERIVTVKILADGPIEEFKSVQLALKLYQATGAPLGEARLIIQDPAAAIEDVPAPPMAPNPSPAAVPAQPPAPPRAAGRINFPVPREPIASPVVTPLPRDMPLPRPRQR